MSSRLPLGQWPATVPVVAQLLREPWELGPLTILVGENGSGKSTIVEAVAAAYGMNPAGGSVHALPGHERWDTSPLGNCLNLERGAGASKWGFFIRAETMDRWFVDQVTEHGGQDFLRRSHGEGFHSLLGTNRFLNPGLYLFDEPESALSFTAQLSLVGQIDELVRGGAQVVMATHSPVLASVPGAQILELDEAGWHECGWEDLAMVDHYRRFLAEPYAYLRHIITAD